MPLTKSETAGLDYSYSKLTLADFEAGRNDTENIAAGDVGELAKAEVGKTGGALSDVLAVIVGVASQAEDKDDTNTVFADFQNTTPSALPDSTQFKLQARKKGELSGRDITGWIGLRGLSKSDPRQRARLTPKAPIVTEGRVISILVRNNTTSVELSFSDSTAELPGQTGD